MVYLFITSKMYVYVHYSTCNQLATYCIIPVYTLHVHVMVNPGVHSHHHVHSYIMHTYYINI